MRTEDPRTGTAGRVADRGEREASELRRGGDERRLVPEHPGAGELDPERQDLVGGRLEDVDPAKAVHLQIDEARNGKTRSATPGRPTAAIRPSSISTSPRTSNPSTTAAATPRFTRVAYVLGCPLNRGPSTGSFGDLVKTTRRPRP